MKHVLVTGSAGFIGSTFVHRLLARHEQVRVVSLDALTYAGDVSNLDGADPERHTFVKGDICDRALVDRLLAEHHIDTIVNFAAESHVDRSIAGSSAFVRTNITGTHALLEAARKAWLDAAEPPAGPVRFHQVSTDEVYGDLDSGAPASSEDDPYQPSSPYAASKASADHLVRAWFRTYGLPVTLSHGGNTYGPRQFPEKLIPVVVARALAGEPIPIYGDGQQWRDWIHVDDHADGILAILEHGSAGRSYNLGGDRPKVNLEVARRICKALDEIAPAGAPHAEALTFVEDRLGHDRRYALSVNRARIELGWRSKVLWSDGIVATVAELAERLAPTA